MTSLPRSHGLPFPWAYPEGLNEIFVLGLFNEEISTGAVGAQDFQRVVVTQELQKIWTISHEAFCWTDRTLERG